MFRDVTDYSKELKIAKEHDGLTGLFNKRKFLELKQSLFRGQKTIAVFNFDVNNLKQMNDTYGHEMGDRLIKKAADSLKAIEARNVLAFRVGGDEFVVVALHVDNEGAERIRKKWEDALEDLNSRSDDIICVIACGMAFGEEGFDLEQILALADQRMYEDKKRKKESGSRAEIPVS
jgi:diguanylate cyclase (GGDEF)-like protein